METKVTKRGQAAIPAAIRERYSIKSGEGDNRVLMGNDPAEIEAMVRHMVETARMTGGYFMCIGNHIPWSVPPEAIKRYLDLSAGLARSSSAPGPLGKGSRKRL